MQIDNLTPTLPSHSQEEAFRLKTLGILEVLAESCGVGLDRTVARTAVFRAERDIPGRWAETWQERLSQIGQEVGLLIRPVQHSYDEAKTLAQEKSTLVTFKENEEETGHWIVLKDYQKGITEKVDDSPIRWVSEGVINRTLAEKPQVVNGHSLGWVTVQPLLPFEPLKEAPREEAHHGPSPLLRLFGLLKQDRNDLWVIVLFSLGVGIFSLATPIAVEAIVSTVQGGTRILLQPVIALSIILLVFLCLAALLRVFQAVVVEFLQQRIFVRVSIDLANRLPQVRIDALDQQHAPELVNRFFDVLTVQKASAVLLLDGLSVVLQTAIGLMVLAFFNPYLLGFDLVLIGAIAFIIFVLGRGAIRTSIKESYAKYGVAGWLEEMARHPLTFKMGGGRSFAQHRANQLAIDYVKARKSHFKILFRQVLFALTLQAVASAALFGLGGWLVINRGLTLGQLVAAELILTMIVGAFIKLGKSLESYYDLMAGMDKLGHLIDLPLENNSGETLPAAKLPLEVSVRDMSFAYTETSNKKLLQSLNLTINRGERVALVGPHGSGKSTLLDLLYSIRQPQSGRIEMDGRDIRDLHLESLRSQVSVIKGVEIFEGTIIENVRVGRGFSLAEVRTALDSVGLLEEILELPDGIQTKLSTGGSPLSYGQIRRLTMARAIIGQPRLMLVDEAFDDLHEEIRERVLQVLFDAEAPWTLLVVTHSKEIVQRCDRQIRLEARNFVGGSP